MHKSLKYLFIVGLFACLGCTTTTVERVEIDEAIDLSGYWNDYDASLVAEEMVVDGNAEITTYCLDSLFARR